MKLYGIKNCDSVKKAKTFLLNQSIDFEFIDFRDNPIDEFILKNWIEQVGQIALINKRSKTYRDFSEAEKQNITLSLILKNPTLIKRPVLLTGNKIIIGFNEENYTEI
jgi:arsenate reductase